MKLYCMVNKLKSEYINDYKEYHENAHKKEWKTQIEAIKQAGAQICNVYLWEELSIVIFGCDDLDVCLSNMAKNKDNKRWQALMAEFFEFNPKFDGSKTVTAEKIFDLAEQSNGFLDKK